MKFDSKLTSENQVRGIVSRDSPRIGILRLVKSVFVGTSVLLRCDYSFALPIQECCSSVWGSAAECHLQLHGRQVYSVAGLRPNQSFLSLCHRRHVASLCMLYKDNSNSNNYCFFLFSELTSASVMAQLIHQRSKFQGVERHNLQCVSCRPRLLCGITFPALCLVPER